jgi:hypothetical protein
MYDQTNTRRNIAMKFLKVLAINCLICSIVMSIAWMSTGLITGVACIYSPTVEDFFKLSPEDKILVNNRDLIGLAIGGFEILLMMIFPYALVLTLSLDGRIAFTQTLAKSQRGREFVERIKSLDASFGRALRKLVGNKT